MNRLVNGMLLDMPFERAHPQLAMDSAQPRASRRPARRETTMTLDSALELIASERERKGQSQLARLIPGYYRLP
jgi:hypothetical protein